MYFNFLLVAPIALAFVSSSLLQRVDVFHLRVGKGVLDTLSVVGMCSLNGIVDKSTKVVSTISSYVTILIRSCSMILSRGGGGT